MAGVDDIDISKFTPRVACLIKLEQLARKEHHRRYYVRRGPINWASFNFDQHRYGFSILTPQFTLIGDQHGIDSCTITIEMVQEMPDESLERDERRDGIDDRGLESMVKDIESIIRQLLRATYPNNDFVCTLSRSSKDEPPVNAQEMSTTDWSFQGFTVTFTVLF